MSRTFQRLVTIGTALLVSLALALPALAYDPPPPSGGTNTNTTEQTASNTAYVSQSAIVVSGDAVAIDGGKAESGDAELWASSEQLQANVQVVGSGVVGACGCGGDLRVTSHDEGGCGCPGSATNDATQTADNYAQASQDGTANTGFAKAVGEEYYNSGVASQNGGYDRFGGTEAESGDTTVKLINEQTQVNAQIVLNAALPGWSFGHNERDGKFGIDSFNHDPRPSGSTASNTSTQTAANTAYSDQAGAGYSGDAIAIADECGPDSVVLIGHGVKAESGEVFVLDKVEQGQLNLQAIVNLAFPWSSTNDSSQDGADYAQAEQGSAAASGDALAVDGKSKAETGEAEAGLVAEQFHGNAQVSLTLNGLPIGHSW